MSDSQAKARLLSRGTGKRGKFNLNRKNLPVKSFFYNLYHSILDLPWWLLFLIFFVYYLCVNLFFASLYYIDVRGITEAQTWGDCFFFSVQTLDTIGYGRLSPTTTYLNVLVVWESLIGLLTQSLFLGVLFGKLSRASRNRRAILFSSLAVVNNKLPCFITEGQKTYYEIGKYPCFAFRCANTRKPQPCDPHVTLMVIAKKKSFYKFQLQRKYGYEVPAEAIEEYGSDDELIFVEIAHELNLQYDRVRTTNLSSMILGVPWVVYHVIDESSPLFGMTAEIMRELQVEIAVVLDAVDEAVSNNYQARYSYTVHDIIWNADFGPMMRFNQKTLEYDVDFDKLNSIQVLKENANVPTGLPYSCAKQNQNREDEIRLPFSMDASAFTLDINDDQFQKKEIGFPPRITELTEFHK